MNSDPAVSLIIPIYNEEKFIKRQAGKLFNRLDNLHISKYEVIFIENGSSDRSFEVIQEICKAHPFAKAIRLATSSYGSAVREGLKAAAFPNIIQLDIDSIDIAFIKKSLPLLKSCDIVIGSKLLHLSKDRRPIPRILVSKVLSFLIKKILGYRGTDTHGIKAYRRKSVCPFVSKIKSNHHFFDTELVLRCQKEGLSVVEIPITVKELRQTRFPTVVRLVQAVPEFLLLYRIIRSEPPPGKIFFEADDFGYAPESDRTIIELDKHHALSLVSIIPNMNITPRSHKFVSPLALHINLIEGKPISRSRDVPTLVDREGNFYPLTQFVLRLLLKKIDKRHIRREIVAQTNVLKKMGYRPSCFTSHQHIHALSPIAEITASLIRSKGASNLRQYGNTAVFTLSGLVRKYFLKIVSAASRLVWYNKLGLPVSWGNTDPAISFLSWESGGKEIWKRAKRGNALRAVIHPGLPFDKNTGYKEDLYNL